MRDDETFVHRVISSIPNSVLVMSFVSLKEKTNFYRLAHLDNVCEKGSKQYCNSS